MLFLRQFCFKLAMSCRLVELILEKMSLLLLGRGSFADNMSPRFLVLVVVIVVVVVVVVLVATGECSALKEK